MLKRHWKVGVFLIIPSFLCCVFLPQLQSKADAETLLKNMTYFTDNTDVTKLTLINGSRTAWYGQCHVSLDWEGHYVLGDFNRDGLKDAAVILFENEGGNLDNYYLAFLINDGTKLIHRRSVCLECRAIINSIREREGKVVVDLFIHQEGDCNAGPTKRVKWVFDYPELGPETIVPVARGEGAPSEADLRYVDRNQEIQGILDTRIPARIRKAFDRKADALFTKKFMVIEMAPINSSSFQAVIIFEGIPHPFWARFNTIKNETVLDNIEGRPDLLGEMFLDETRGLAYERFWT